jgi:hypothetical protein
MVAQLQKAKRKTKRGKRYNFLNLIFLSSLLYPKVFLPFITPA